MMSRESPRQRRLRSDHAKLRQLQSRSDIFTFTAAGDPPEEYLLTFCGTGLMRPDEEGPVGRCERHIVEVRLSVDYPRCRPDLFWKTPLYHPNISTSGGVCLGGYSTHWSPSLHLDRLCEMLWNMIRYANFDVRSPYNYEAGRWAASQKEFRFPVDTRPLKHGTR